ncbi:MAG: hypothetical protein K6F84_07115 [Lachnospiraceae bacterium]|nr:hypothetical protein [Lachnospiraceae bacterium]
MGEKIKKIKTIHIGDEEFEVELNAPESVNGEEIIHIQNDKYRFACSKSDFVDIATQIVGAGANLRSYKGL